MSWNPHNPEKPPKTVYLVCLQNTHEGQPEIIVNLLQIQTIRQVEGRDSEWVELLGRSDPDGRQLEVQCHKSEWQLLKSLCINAESEP